MDSANRRRALSRREWLKLSASGVAAASASGWFETLASGAAADPARRRSCILLWMAGGPSQIDTFDPKPGHENGGQTRAIETSVPGLKIAEHLPRLAARADDLAVIRSMTTKEGTTAGPRTSSGPATCRTGRSATPPSAPWSRRRWSVPTTSCPTSSPSARSGGSTPRRTAPDSWARSTRR